MTKNGSYPLEPMAKAAGRCNPESVSEQSKRILINRGLVCPYCDGRSEHIDSAEVYGYPFGMIYICRPCNAWVGTHKGFPTVATGRLGKSELRDAKKLAHQYFDMIWKNGHMKRSDAYRWLAKQLRIARKDCHIGFFDTKQCAKVIEVSKKFLNI